MEGFLFFSGKFLKNLKNLNMAVSYKGFLYKKPSVLHTKSTLLHTDLENFEGRGSINSSVLLPNFWPFPRGGSIKIISRGGYPPDPSPMPTYGSQSLIDGIMGSASKAP